MQSDHAHVSLVVRKMQGSRRRNAEGTGTVSSLAQLINCYAEEWLSWWSLSQVDKNLSERGLRMAVLRSIVMVHLNRRIDRVDGDMSSEEETVWLSIQAMAGWGKW